MRPLFFLLLLLLPATAAAQNTRLEAMLENQLSNDDRRVEIDGFAGALSSRATMEALRVSDSQGVWIELTGLALDWNRAALLRGRLSVRELIAESIVFTRPPVSEGPSVPSSQASGFRIPDLPLSLLIDRLAVERITLGPEVLGEPVEATLTLSGVLADGGLELDLDALRTDAQPGEALVTLAFEPEGEVLSIDLAVTEPEGGIVARSLSLPGLPSVALTVAGAGPLDDFRADIGLATDGADRLSGQVTLAAQGEGVRGFEADLAGDIRPLLDAETRAFFGAETRLTATGAQDNGALRLDNLRLSAAAFDLAGSGALDPEGRPQQLQLAGRLGGGEADAVTQLPGSDVTLRGAEIALSFDATVSDDWDVTVTAQDITTPDVTVATVTLDGQGEITPGAAIPFAGAITAQLAGLETPVDPRISAALGRDLRLSTNIAADAEGAFSLSDLSVETDPLTLAGAARVAPTEGRLALSAEVTAAAPDLSPFSAFAGQDISGALTAEVAATAELPGGAVTVSLTGVSEEIEFGVEALRPLLIPQSTLSLALTRDEAGSRIDAFEFDNPEVTAQLSGSLDAEDGAVTLTANLREVGLFTDLVSGPVVLDVALEDLQGDQRLGGQLETAFGLDARVAGALAGVEAGVALDGTLEEIERFVAQLNGRAELSARVDLAGDVPALDATLAAAPGVSLAVTGPLSGPDQAFDIAARVDDLGVFAAPLPGPATIDARVFDLSNGPAIDASLRATPGVTAQISGRVTGPEEGVDLRADVADLGFLVPLLAGPAQLEARLDDLTSDLLVDAQLSATPGLTVRVSGRPLSAESPVAVVADAQSLDFIAPQLAGAANVTATLRDLTGQQAFEADISSAIGLTARAEGQLASPGDAVTLTARLNALGALVDGLTGGATVDAQVTGLQATPRVTAALSTDSGAAVDVTGDVGLPGGAVALTASGQLPLAIAQGFVADRALDGAARFDLALNGPPALNAVTGSVTLRDARFFDPALGLTLSPIEVDIALSGGRATVDGTAALSGSRIRMTGGAGLTAPYPLEMDLNATRLPIRLADILENETSFELALRGSAAERLNVAGDVRIEDTEIRIPDTGLGGAPDVPPIRHVGAPQAVQQTLSRAGISLSGIPPEPGAGPEIPLDISLSAITPVFVRGRGIDAGFDGTVRITGTAANPVPIGELQLTRGRLDFLGRRLDLDEGRITVAGSLVPQIDITARSTVDDVSAEINLTGPVDEPVLGLSSVPELPEDEILARVLFGRGIETLSAFQVARLVNSLRQLSGGGAGILESTRSGLGIDDLDFRTDDATGEAELAIGQTLNEGVYTEVEVGSGGTTRLNLNFDISDSTTLRGSASSDGGTGVGVFWERDY